MISFGDTIQFNDAIHCTQMIYITCILLFRAIQTTIRLLYGNNSNIFICLLRQTYTIHTGNYINMINDMYFFQSLFLLPLLPLLLLFIFFVLVIRIVICEPMGSTVCSRFLAWPQPAISFLFKFNRFDQFYSFACLFSVPSVRM